MAMQVYTENGNECNNFIIKNNKIKRINKIKLIINSLLKYLL